MPDSQLEVLAVAVALLSVAIALGSLSLSLRGDRRKEGVEVRCDFSVSSSSISAERWVSKIVLENRKDRTLAIYRIYLQVGHGTYVTVEDLEDEPLVLEPYDVKTRQYDPVEFYAVNDSRVSGIWHNPDSAFRLLLVTSEGRHYASRGIDRMGPFLDVLLRNALTMVMYPLRWTYEGVTYGSNVEYLIRITEDDSQERILPIYPYRFGFQPFQEFDITAEAMESRESLEEFLAAVLDDNSINYTDIEVIDADSLRKEEFDQYSNPIELPHYNWATFHILGKLWTLWQRRPWG